MMEIETAKADRKEIIEKVNQNTIEIKALQVKAGLVAGVVSLIIWILVGAFARYIF